MPAQAYLLRFGGVPLLRALSFLPGSGGAACLSARGGVLPVRSARRGSGGSLLFVGKGGRPLDDGVGVSGTGCRSRVLPPALLSTERSVAPITESHSRAAPKSIQSSSVDIQHLVASVTAPVATSSGSFESGTIQSSPPPGGS